MLLNLLERLVFGVLLLAALQIPLICDHYLQFINGVYLTRKHDVERIEENARVSEYPSMDAMLDDLSTDIKPAVRHDVEQKRQILEEYRQAGIQVDKLQNGNYFERGWVVLSNPEISSEVLRNFKPGIPLNPKDIVYSFLVSILLSGLLSLIGLGIRWLWRKWRA